MTILTGAARISRVSRPHAEEAGSGGAESRCQYESQVEYRPPVMYDRLRERVLFNMVRAPGSQRLLYCQVLFSNLAWGQLVALSSHRMGTVQFHPDGSGDAGTRQLRSSAGNTVLS